MGRPNVTIVDLGLISYREAWEYQTKIHRQLIEVKRANREVKRSEIKQQHHRLIFCEHTPVYTLGKSGSENNLLASQDKLDSLGAEFHKINRGGDITFHGPGQIVGYPIFDLDEFFTDVHRYVRMLEQVVIDTLADFDIYADRLPGYTGVWLPRTHSKSNRKICAIGVHLSRWVTLHGFAFNVNTDLNYFNQIIPCGISEVDMEVTSLAQEKGELVSLDLVKERLITHFSDSFNFDISFVTTSELQ